MSALKELLERVEKATGPDRHHVSGVREFVLEHGAADRFWKKVDIQDVESCWNWTGSLMSKGYGQFSVGPRVGHKNLRAHRVAYELTAGTIPSGMDLDHLCRNRRCVNPAHLEPVSASVNNKRAGAARTHCARGHAMETGNIAKGRNGTKECRACRLQRKRAYRARTA